MNDEGNGDRQTNDVVRGTKVGMASRDFAVLNDNEAANESKDANSIENGVDMGTFPFLFRGMGWLNDENGLSDEENASRVEELGRKQKRLIGQIWRRWGEG